jgi:hypothetical protein
MIAINNILRVRGTPPEADLTIAEVVGLAQTLGSLDRDLWRLASIQGLTGGVMGDARTALSSDSEETHSPVDQDQSHPGRTAEQDQPVGAAAVYAAGVQHRHRHDQRERKHH